MKFDQLIKYSVWNIFFKHHAENGRGRLVPDIFLLISESFNALMYFGRPWLGHTIKTNYSISDC